MSVNYSAVHFNYKIGKIKSSLTFGQLSMDWSTMLVLICIQKTCYGQRGLT